MTLADWTWRFELEGDHIDFGDGTDLDIVGVDALDGWDVRTSSRNIPRGHGMAPGSHFLPGLEPVFHLEAMGDQEEVELLRERWAAGFIVSEETQGRLMFKRPGTDERYFHARVVARDWPLDAAGHGQIVESTVAFEITDPRAYSTALKKVQLEPFSASGGLDYPVNYPKNWTVVGNDKVAANGGNIGSPPLIRFFGPDSGTMSAVQLINRTTGVTLDVKTDINPGQTLTFDVRAFVAATGDRVVDLDGANRYGSWQHPRVPLLIEKGDNLLRFTGDGSTDGARCVVSHRDARA